MDFTYDDGGRRAAGYAGDTGDCVTRAVAIATGLPYQTVYAEFFERAGESPRKGVARKVYEPYLKELGWEWTPTMGIGTGCTVHLREEELPGGNIIVRLSKHVCAVIGGVIHDTYDPSRDGTRCVYGYFQGAVL
jgi:hypothetical protein